MFHAQNIDSEGASMQGLKGQLFTFKGYVVVRGILYLNSKKIELRAQREKDYAFPKNKSI